MLAPLDVYARALAHASSLWCSRRVKRPEALALLRDGIFVCAP